MVRANALVVEPYSVNGILAADCPILYIFKHCSTLVLGFFTLIIADYVVAIKTLKEFPAIRGIFDMHHCMKEL